MNATKLSPKFVKVISPKKFNVSVVFNETSRLIACQDESKREWINPCDIEAVESGSVH